MNRLTFCDTCGHHNAAHNDPDDAGCTRCSCAGFRTSEPCGRCNRPVGDGTDHTYDCPDGPRPRMRRGEP